MNPFVKNKCYKILGILYIESEPRKDAEHSELSIIALNKNDKIYILDKGRLIKNEDFVWRVKILTNHGTIAWLNYQLSHLKSKIEKII